MTIIDAVRVYLGTCPLLQGNKLNVDFLPPDAATYSVDVVPAQPILQQYMDGSSKRQFLFTLATRSYYGMQVRQQVDNLGFFEQFEKWIVQQNQQKVFPILGVGRACYKLEVTTSGYIFAPNMDTARYQIQCRLSYYEKGER